PPQREPYRGQRRARLGRVRFLVHERAAVPRWAAAVRRAGLPADRRHRTRAPLCRCLVAGRPRPGIRAPLHSSGRRLRARDQRRRRRTPRLRRSGTRAARARRGRGERSIRQPIHRSGRSTSMTATRKALVVGGGWEGHRPVEATDMFIPFLQENGFDVRVEDSNEVYADGAVMEATDLIVQSATMSDISGDARKGLRRAVERGTGLAGWHGGIADSYRNSSDYLQLIGGQFATHPSKHPDSCEGDESDNFLCYTVDLTDLGRGHEIMDGLEDFTLRTEQ